MERSRGFVVLSGGVAPGLADDFPQRIQEAISPKEARLIVDTSKAPLARLVAHPKTPVYLLRVDQREAAGLAGHALVTREDSAEFAAELVARGVARVVIVARGAEGSVLVSEDARYWCESARVPMRSAIGAGDAFVGALTLALSRGDPLDQALRWGVAAACDTVTTDRTALCSAAGVTVLLDQCRVHAI